jgi:hypothetical protein
MLAVLFPPPLQVVALEMSESWWLSPDPVCESEADGLFVAAVAFPMPEANGTAIEKTSRERTKLPRIIIRATMLSGR